MPETLILAFSLHNRDPQQLDIPETLEVGSYRFQLTGVVSIDAEAEEAENQIYSALVRQTSDSEDHWVEFTSECATTVD